MAKKLRKAMDKFCNWMELLLAVLAGMALLISGAVYVLSAIGVLSGPVETGNFSLFLNDIFAFVVGIEFIQMLLKPSVDNVIEVLVFLVTRHLILSQNSALDMLGCVVSILLLYAFHFLLHYLKLRYRDLAVSIERDASNIGSIEEKQEAVIEAP